MTDRKLHPALECFREAPDDDPALLRLRAQTATIAAIEGDDDLDGVLVRRRVGNDLTTDAEQFAQVRDGQLVTTRLGADT